MNLRTKFDRLKIDPLDFVQSTYLFENFSESAVQELLIRSQSIMLEEGEVLFQPHDPATAMFIVCSGFLEIVSAQDDAGEGVLGKIGPEMVVGEIGMLEGGTYSQHVCAVVSTQLLKIEGEVFFDIIKKNFYEIDQIRKTVYQHFWRSQLANVVSKVFGTVNEKMLCDIETHSDWVHLRRGEVLFKAGDFGNKIYAVVSGRLQTYVTNMRGKQEPLGAEIVRGEPIGEVEIFAGVARKGTVHAIRESYLIAFSRERFEVIINLYPMVLRKINEILANRLVGVTASPSLKNTEVSIAVIPHALDVPIGEFVECLVRCLSVYGPTFYLNGTKVDKILGKDGICQDLNCGRLACWLNEQETAYRFMVYEADVSATDWTERCIRQADRVLIVGKGTGNPAKNDIEEKYLSSDDVVTAAEQVLILLHPNDKTLPKGTNKWLSARSSLKMHHHIRLDVKGDLERLARFLTGNHIAVVFSGGGARGFAHIGVIRAFMEESIPIDVIGGTSMGGLVAVAYAMGWNADAIVKYAKMDIVRKRVFKEYTALPIISMLKCEKFDASIKIPCGETLIEDLWINYFCTSTNLTTSELRVHRSGYAWEALRESCSIPGIINPALHNHNLIVDGGLINNLPCNIMRELYGGYIIAVDVSGLDNLTAPYEKYPSPWKILYTKLNPFTKTINVPMMKDIIVQAIMVSSIHKNSTLRKYADFCIQPPVGDFGGMDMAAVEDIAETSYRYVKKKIITWKREKNIQKML